MIWVLVWIYAYIVVGVVTWRVLRDSHEFICELWGAFWPVAIPVLLTAKVVDWLAFRWDWYVARPRRISDSKNKWKEPRP